MSLALFDLLLDIATLSAQLRIRNALGLIPSNEDKDAWGRRDHPFIRLNDEILRKMGELGRLCRDNEADIRTSAFWPLLAFQDVYVERYEYRLKVRLQELSPSAIYQGLSRGNKLLWKGWEVYLGSSRETTDDFGQPAWEPRVWISSPSKDVAMLSGISRATARTAYLLIAGEPFASDDGLRGDPPYAAFFAAVEMHLRDHYSMSPEEAKRTVDNESGWLAEICAEERDAASAAKTIVHHKE
jgi:hypothetical protein